MKGPTDFNDMSDAEAIRRRVNSAVHPDASEKCPDMSIVERHVAPAPQLALAMFGPWREWIASAAEAKSAPADYVALALMTGAAGLIGATRWVAPWSEWREPAIIWGMCVGSPSAGKSPALDAVRAALDEIDREIGLGHAAARKTYDAAATVAEIVCRRWETDIANAVKAGNELPPKPDGAHPPDEPAAPRVLITDATIEATASVLAGNPRGLLLWRDELAAWAGNLAKYGDGDRAFWLESYGGRPYTVDRKKLAAPLLLRHLAVSIIGGIQPDRLSSLIFAGDDDGLPGRFIYVWPEPVPPRRPTKRPDTTVLVRAFRRLRGLDFIELQGQPSPVTLPVDNAALAEWQAWREHHHAASKGVSGALAAAFGKMPGQALRIALVLELLWWAAGESPHGPTAVSGAALGFALDLIEDYIKPMARRSFGEAALPVADRNATTLARAILERGAKTINARSVRREWRLPGLAESAAVDAAITLLIEARWLASTPDRQGEGPGRKRKDFTVNPAVHGARL